MTDSPTGPSWLASVPQVSGREIAEYGQEPEDIDKLYFPVADVLAAVPPQLYGSEVLCESCAKVFCPHGEQLHFHHDGCPACSDDEGDTTPYEVLPSAQAGLVDALGGDSGAVRLELTQHEITDLVISGQAYTLDGKYNLRDRDGLLHKYREALGAAVPPPSPALEALIKEYWAIRHCSPATPWCDAPVYMNEDHYHGHSDAKDAVMRKIEAALAAAPAREGSPHPTEQEETCPKIE